MGKDYVSDWATKFVREVQDKMAVPVAVSSEVGSIPEVLCNLIRSKPEYVEAIGEIIRAANQVATVTILASMKDGKFGQTEKKVLDIVREKLERNEFISSEDRLAYTNALTLSGRKSVLPRYEWMLCEEYEPTELQGFVMNGKPVGPPSYGYSLLCLVGIKGDNPVPGCYKVRMKLARYVHGAGVWIPESENPLSWSTKIEGVYCWCSIEPPSERVMIAEE